MFAWSVQAIHKRLTCHTKQDVLSRTSGRRNGQRCHISLKSRVGPNHNRLAIQHILPVRPYIHISVSRFPSCHKFAEKGFPRLPLSKGPLRHDNHPLLTASQHYIDSVLGLEKPRRTCSDNGDDHVVRFVSWCTTLDWLLWVCKAIIQCKHLRRTLKAINIEDVVKS